MSKPLILGLLIYFNIAQAFTQEKAQLMELLAKALAIQTEVKILSDDKKAAWSMQIVRLTIPGKTVQIQLKGKNLNLFLMLTPYQTEDAEHLILIVQNQIIQQLPDTRSGKFYSNLKQIAIKMGEKIQYYPLGTGEANTLNLLIEFRILKYQDALAEKLNMPDPEILLNPAGP